jgi:hypothetical protein
VLRTIVARFCPTLIDRRYSPDYITASTRTHRSRCGKLGPLARFVVPLLLGGVSIKAGSITLNFEGVPDSTPIREIYLPLGVDFFRATAITAGVSLNELEFPPHSGQNVAFDNSGNIILTFTTPVLSVGGYFNYSVPITMVAFGPGNLILGSATSQHSSNDALFGDPGSIPNEFLGLNIAGIVQVTITGDPAGSSFTMDDLSFTTAGTVPEPTTIVLTFPSLIALGIAIRATKTR